ncbi:hypothetical protein BK120_33900 [Paenibacillus sp. FSL A5-0031]|uniref:hypothetical protein n=1 Tax=Paenibacillus sp. FSL A5-0031 TaxID=1920420 RepID=UPI00096CF3A2|nr:hypothetical protein [Paenibacillus sp. FSL A5-0031]OME69178.1 hypothetical protein BK120_33900 [Paenibacillus sp. FSL A5-0031]
MSHDLFSYFGVDDSNSSTKPISSPAPEGEMGSASDATAGSAADDRSNDTCETGTDKNKVVYLASDRLRGNKSPKEQPDDACEDEDVLSEDPEEDEVAAEYAELGGMSANTEIVKSDLKSTVTTGNTEAKKEEKKPAFNHVTYICYAGHKFLITKFFDQEKLATLDLENVRKRLEKDFPELSKQRTKMEWDERKNIICPMVTGGKKGASFSQGLKGFFFRSKDLFEKKEPINILAARDGYYEVRGVRCS